MALNDITIINEVTKTELVDGFEYIFPLVQINTVTSGDTIEIFTKFNPVRTRTVSFSSISADLGATNAEEYADALALGRYFFAADTRIDPKLTDLIKYFFYDDVEDVLVQLKDISDQTSP